MGSGELTQLERSQSVQTSAKMTSSAVADIRAQALDNLYFFLKGVLGFDKLDPEIHFPICQQLEQYETQTRQGILLPRGWYKSTICSIGYPIWRAAKNPNFTSLLAQNTYMNAVAKLRKIKGVFEENQVFRTLFPEILPTRNSVWKADSLEVNRSERGVESTFEAAGTRTQVTGRHYNLITEDDTVAPELNELGSENLCPTKDDIATAIGWHRLATPLLIDPGTDQLLVVGTRWFQEDLISWVQQNEKNYKWYVRAVREDAQGNPDENSPPSYPKRFSEDVLEDLERALGPYMFSCLYMNKPLRSGDMIFQPQWFQYYEVESTHLAVYTTVDPAGDPAETKSRDQDYSVVMTCGKDLYSGNIYVLDYSRKRCSPSELITTIFKHVEKWHPLKVGVESVALQKMLISFIKERMVKEKRYFLCEPITNNRKSKSARIQGLQPFVFNGKLMFRKHMTDLVNELLVFPLGAHDDLIDALAMQVELWATSRSVSERKSKGLSDPMSVEYAIKELRGRHEFQGGIGYDVMHKPVNKKFQATGLRNHLILPDKVRFN